MTHVPCLRRPPRSSAPGAAYPSHGALQGHAGRQRHLLALHHARPGPAPSLAHRRAIGPVIGAHGGVPGRVGMEGQRGVSVTRGCDGWGGAADDCAALRAGPHQGPVGALERGRHRLLVRPPPRPPRLTPTASAPRIPVALRAPLRLRGGGAVRDQGLIDAAARPVPAAGTARMPKGHAWPRAAAVPRPLNNVSGT